MLELIKYQSAYAQEWDRLISNSRNGTFLFYRDYLEYHSNRFTDHSFLIMKTGNLEEVIPGNINGTTFYSHQGISYGGIVSSTNICMSDVLEIFKILNNDLQKTGIKEVIYKSIPWIYHNSPCEEDIYGLFVNNAEKIGCNISSVINMNKVPKFSKLRERCIKKSIREGVVVGVSDNFFDFWEILENNLKEKYNLKPTHTLDEILFLKNKFPDNIKLITALHQGKIVAGVVLFNSVNVVHVQYIAANSEGKLTGALDLIFEELIHNQLVQQSFFDFGISTERMGKFLNENLIFQKEGFGARGVVYNIFRYTIS